MVLLLQTSLFVIVILAVVAAACYWIDQDAQRHDGGDS
jgi:preprotein translocase subunit SecE